MRIIYKEVAKEAFMPFSVIVGIMKVYPEINKFVEQNGLNQKELMGGKVSLRTRETQVSKIAVKLVCGGHKLVASSLMNSKEFTMFIGKR